MIHEQEHEALIQESWLLQERVAELEDELETCRQLKSIQDIDIKHLREECKERGERMKEMREFMGSRALGNATVWQRFRNLDKKRAFWFDENCEPIENPKETDK